MNPLFSTSWLVQCLDCWDQELKRIYSRKDIIPDFYLDLMLMISILHEIMQCEHARMGLLYKVQVLKSEWQDINKWHLLDNVYTYNKVRFVWLVAVTQSTSFGTMLKENEEDILSTVILDERETRESFICSNWVHITLGWWQMIFFWVTVILFHMLYSLS